MSSPKTVKKRTGCLVSLILLFLCGTASIVVGVLVIDALNLGGKIKSGIRDIIGTEARTTPPPPPPPKPEVKIVEKIVEVPVEKIVEKIVKVEVPPPMPSSYIPWQKIDTAKLWSGIRIKNTVEAPQGDRASVERETEDAYELQLKLSFRIPKPGQTFDELKQLNPHLSAMLPGLENLLATSKVSPFYHHLYENKTRRIQEKATRLDQLLSVHNLYDTETVLEIENPETAQKALLIQGEMDVVSDGSDGDRWPFLDNYISMSDYYQPFTSYGWPKQTRNPNPLLERWQANLKKYRERFAVTGLSIQENRFLRERIETLPREIADMKARSYLIAEADPFIVMSLAFLGRRDETEFGPMIGDYAVVIHEDKLFPAIIGDAGPSWKSGEASLRIAREINPEASPYSRPVSDLTVTYLVFPASREEKNAPPDLRRWHDRCREYLDKLGGIGEGYALHQWEDLIAKKLEEKAREAQPAPAATEEPPVEEPPSATTSGSESDSGDGAPDSLEIPE